VGPAGRTAIVPCAGPQAAVPAIPHPSPAAAHRVCLSPCPSTLCVAVFVPLYLALSLYLSLSVVLCVSNCPCACLATTGHQPRDAGPAPRAARSVRGSGRPSPMRRGSSSSGHTRVRHALTPAAAPLFSLLTPPPYRARASRKLVAGAWEQCGDRGPSRRPWTGARAGGPGPGPEPAGLPEPLATRGSDTARSALACDTTPPLTMRRRQGRSGETMRRPGCASPGAARERALEPCSRERESPGAL
jgi:hypothetical protein